MPVTDNKKQNIEKAEELIRVAAKDKARIVVLPEMFNCPYDNSKFAEYAEEFFKGPTTAAIASLAKQLGIYIVAGSIPEADEEYIYNSCLVFDQNGNVIGKHRKMHMFDIDVKDKITFKESDTLTPGSNITIVETEFCSIGIAICFDMRFPELFKQMALKGARVVIIPAAFNMVTGPAHWELLLRTRAVDNQVYVAAASPSRDEKASYTAYGNSMIVDPWGKVISRAGANEAIVFAEIDLDYVEKVRNELPVLKNRRTDIYDVIEV